MKWAFVAVVQLLLPWPCTASPHASHGEPLVPRPAALASHWRIRRQQQPGSNSTGPVTNGTLTETKAERIVIAAQAEAAERNARLVANVRRNKYVLREGPPAAARKGDDTATGVNATVAEAARLVTEMIMTGNQTVFGQNQNRTASEDDAEGRQLAERQATDYWMAAMTQNGRSPFVPDPNYKVWRNVWDFGAKGDGVTDDTDAIERAVKSGPRCEQACGSSSTLFAVVYFPPGTYIVSRSITQLYMTQFIGHPTNRPVIKASAAFVGLGMMSTNVYIEGGNSAEWYINQSNFFRQIRNFVLDITNAPLNAYVAALHWQVAQATSLQNIKFVMSTVPGNNQQGIFMENGSGGFMSDLEFEGGTLGAYVGNQQFTVRNLKFRNQQTRAIEIHWDWGWTWKGLDIRNTPIAIMMSTPKDYTEVGSAIFIDSVFENCGVGIELQNPTQTNKISVSIFNLRTINVPSIVKWWQGGATLLAGGGGTTQVEAWGIGKRYDTSKGETSGVWQNGENYPRAPAISPQLLKGPGQVGGQSGFFERSKPQYESLPASAFVNLKSVYGAAGDGSTDDTAALNAALTDTANNNKILWIPAGVFMVSDTVFFPNGAKVVGQVWSQIMGYGAKFADERKPYPVVKVGNRGDVGTMEIQDMLFTVRGATAGAIVLQWNIEAEAAGAAAMWDVHVRVGGAAGSNLQVGNCPKHSGTVNRNCMAAAMLVHLTAKSSAYFENTWFWVADHDLDIPAQTQIDIYVGRGVLIESVKPVWLYGTGSEHCILYQYQTLNAANVFMGMIQTESPYFQATPRAPEPYGAQVFPSDPSFSLCPPESKTCAISWGLRILNSKSIYLYGGGLYSWFSEYSQTCVGADRENCQDKMVDIQGSSDIWIYSLITKATVQMISPAGGKPVMASENKINFCSIVMAWLGRAAGRAGSGSGSGGSSGVKHKSPTSATIIPFPKSSVAPTQTFTVGGPVVSDIMQTPNDGDQNSPPGPGKQSCQQCDLARLLTSTCCGTGGSVSNPIEIPPGEPLPRDLVLPKGFIPNQEIKDKNTGIVYPPAVPLPTEVVVPERTSFPFPFRIPPGQPMSDIYTPEPMRDNADNGTLYITSIFWEGDRTISCSWPCTIVLPPFTTTRSWDPPPMTTTITQPGTTITSVIDPPPQSTQRWRVDPIIVKEEDDDDDDGIIVILPIPNIKPVCIKFTIPILNIQIQIGICPPNLNPFPPGPPLPPITVIPVPPGRTPGPTTPDNEPERDEDEDDDDDDDDNQPKSCPINQEITTDRDPVGMDIFYGPRTSECWTGCTSDADGNPVVIPGGPGGTGGTGGGGAGTGTPTTSTTTTTTTGTPPTNVPGNPTGTPDPSTEWNQCWNNPNPQYMDLVEDHIDRYCRYVDSRADKWIRPSDLWEVNVFGIHIQPITFAVGGARGCLWEMKLSECRRIMNKAINGRNGKNGDGPSCNGGGVAKPVMAAFVNFNCGFWGLSTDGDPRAIYDPNVCPHPLLCPYFGGVKREVISLNISEPLPF